MDIKTRLKKDRLEKSLKLLEEDYKVTSSQLNITGDEIEKNRLKRRLSQLEEEMQKLTDELNEADNSTNHLISILECHFNIHRDILLQCYKQSLPIRLINSELPQNTKELISGLLLPQDLEYSYIEKFVVYSLLNKKISPQLKEQLQEWAKANIQDLDRLSGQVTKEQQKKQQQSHPCLILAISTCADNYTVEAWLIKNLDEYHRDSFSDCEQLKIAGQAQISTNKTLDNLPELLRNLICECTVKIKQIHIFLPLELMNYAVDSWKTYEDEEETIGEIYEIFIRCSEGLRGKNPRLIAWREKGLLFKDKLSQPADDIFIVGDSQEIKTLEKKLKQKEAIAVKIIPVFENKLPGEILWKAAVPLALWVRQDLPDVENSLILDELINDCCLEKLPERIKAKRLDAMDTEHPEDHIGRHLCLLWDDPNLLPPEQLLTEINL
jgi:hypothetical protein